MLAKLRIREDLTLYLFVLEHDVSGVLIRDEATAQTPSTMSGKSFKMQKLGTRRSKLALALVVAARKLRPYFQAHIILVPTSHPFLQVLQNPEVFERLTKWMIELGEFDIKFMPKTAIKGQAIADFVAEFTYPTKAFGGTTNKASTSEGRTKDDDPIDPSNVWSLRIDDSSNVNGSNVNGSGACVILESPTREKVSYALRLEFPASNNEAKYKMLIAELLQAR